MAVLHRAHTSGFCSALEQLSHSVALLLSLSAGCVLRPWHLQEQLQTSSKSTHDLNMEALNTERLTPSVTKGLDCPSVFSIQ